MPLRINDIGHVNHVAYYGRADYSQAVNFETVSEMRGKLVFCFLRRDKVGFIGFSVVCNTVVGCEKPPTGSKLPDMFTGGAAQVSLGNAVLSDSCGKGEAGR